MYWQAPQLQFLYLVLRLQNGTLFLFLLFCFEVVGYDMFVKAPPFLCCVDAATERNQSTTKTASASSCMFSDRETQTVYIIVVELSRIPYIFPSQQKTWNLEVRCRATVDNVLQQGLLGCQQTSVVPSTDLEDVSTSVEQSVTHLSSSSSPPVDLYHLPS